MGTIINGIGITPWKGRSLIRGNMPDPGPRNYYEEVSGYNWYLMIDGDDVHGIYDPALTYSKTYINPNLYNWGEKYGIYDRIIGGWNIDYTESTKYQTSLCTADLMFPDGERYKCPQEVKDLGLLSFKKVTVTVEFTISEDIRYRQGKYSDIENIVLGGFGNSECLQIRAVFVGNTLYLQRNIDGVWFGIYTEVIHDLDLNKSCLFNLILTRNYNNEVTVEFRMRNSDSITPQKMGLSRFNINAFTRMDRVFWGNGYTDSSSDRAIEGFWGIFHYGAFSTEDWYIQ